MRLYYLENYQYNIKISQNNPPLSRFIKGGLKEKIMFKIKFRFNLIIYVLILFLFSNILVFTQEKNEGVFYEIFVRSFYDSDDNGKGDFIGLIKKLNYLNDGNPKTNKDLGIEGIWLMPILESPSYHGYDVVDYFKIEKDYGTIRDFQKFIKEAHKRGIKVIMDLVLNHTSSWHPWFLKDCRAKKKESKKISTKPHKKTYWYVWENTLPKGWTKPWGGGESKDVWHYKNGSYYYSSFCAGMPDLNYKNEEVVKEIKRIAKYWLDMGIDGFRLDGVRYLIENNGGVLGQADIKETHIVLKDLASYVKSINKDCILIGEIWAGNNIAQEYYGECDELDSAFNFDLAGAIINSIKSNNYKGIENVLNKMNKYNAPANFYASFLSNHDQNRIASELNGDIERLKLAASLLLSMRGTPFIYYGEEIGMTGKGRHENIRTPMHWNKTEHGGFTMVTPWQKLQDNYKQINVASQKRDKSSLFNHYKKLIMIRNKYWNPIKEKRKHIKTNKDKIYAYIYYATNKEGLLFIHNFNNSKVMNTRLSLYEAGFNNEKYKAINLMNKDTQNINWLSLSDLKINYLQKYESLIFKIVKSE